MGSKVAISSGGNDEKGSKKKSSHYKKVEEIGRSEDSFSIVASREVHWD